MTDQEIRTWIEKRSDRYASFAYRDKNNKTTGGTYSDEGIEVDLVYELIEKIKSDFNKEIEYCKQKLSDCEDMQQKMGREGSIDAEK